MFSIVIPLFNKESSIVKTIESVLTQEFKDFEVIVVDDGSTDRSVDAVLSMKDERIKIISQENKGVSSARNAGIKEAKYEWIALLDGDDIWLPGHLNEINKMISRYRYNKVFVTSFSYSDNRDMFKHSRSDDMYEIHDYFKEAIREKIMWTSIVVFNRSCFSSVGGFNEKINRGEDLDLWARLAKSHVITKSSHVTAIYNVDDNNSLSKGKSKYSTSILSLIDLKDKVGYERVYFKRMLYNRLKLDIKSLDWKEFFEIIFRHNLQLLK
ncbi:TPA: glycosyltransferase [Vibrio parahaemolyticus]|nr:glycosyltransferase [Vibrio parahaemolyticus]